MRTVIGLTLCMMMGTVAAAQDSKPTTGQGVSPEAVEILKQSEAALKRIKIVRYQADYTGTAWIKQYVPTVTGTATVGKRSKYDIDPFFVEVKMTTEGAEEPIECSAGCNGDTYFLIDAKTKTVYEDMDPAVLGSQGRNIPRVVMSEFASPKPYENAEKAGTVQLRGTERINDKPCHVVFIEGEQPPTLTYYIDAMDHLPRKIVRTYKNEEGVEGTTELTISHLAINPDFEKSPFEAKVPAGYKKTDDFAP